MIDVRQTLTFKEWHHSLRDRVAARKVAIRLSRVQAGLMGDVKYFAGIGATDRSWARLSALLRQER